MNARRRIFATAVIALSCCGSIIGLAESAHHPAGAAAEPRGAVNTAAPDFSGPVVSGRGGSFSLKSLRGHPVLITFLDTQAEAGASRSQIVFVKSMETQSGPDGLRAIVVDAARAVGVAPPSRDELINYGYDNALPSTIRVVGDRDGSIAKAYGVHTVPTTVLVDKAGVVKHRWDGFASAAQLDFAIRPLVGRPMPGAASR